MSGIKRKALSISDKLNILKNYDEGCDAKKKQKDIAKELGIPSSTLRTVLKNRREIEEKGMLGENKRQKLKRGKYEELEQVLLEWFQQARSLNYPVNGSIITEKAKQIAESFNITDFCGSSGWLDRFRSRHGIVYRQISGEAESVLDEDVAVWKDNVLPLILRDYSPEDVYNADEFGLFYKLMPDKSFVFKNETCHGGKMSKERLTVLACTNITGNHKLKLVVIGKSKSPRCFKNVRTFPCDYLSQKHAWMTSELFTRWIQQLDYIFGKEKRKILLFIDNCPAHPKDIPVTNIKVVFLPPNSTSKLQPLDQGIIKVLKQKYRKKLVQRFLSDMECTNATKINVLDSLNYISAAWDEITPNVIRNCFRKAAFCVWQDFKQDDSSSVEDEDFPSLQNFPDYAAVDDNLVTSSTRTLEEMIADATTVENGNDEQENDDEQEEEEEPVPIPTVAVGLQYLNELRKVLSSLEHADEMLSYTNKIDNFLSVIHIQNLKQTKIDSFFPNTSEKQQM